MQRSRISKKQDTKKQTTEIRPTALVTGSSRGIGLGAAVQLARAGFAIAVNGPTEDDELTAAVETVSAEGSEMTASVIAQYEQRAKDGLTVLPRVGTPEDMGRRHGQDHRRAGLGPDGYLSKPQAEVGWQERRFREPWNTWRI